MKTLDSFTVGTAALCAMIPLAETSFSTLKTRDGLFFNHPRARSGVANEYSLGDALQLALALELKGHAIPSRDACVLASASDAIGSFIAGRPVEFGFTGGRLSNSFDRERDPVLSLDLAQIGEALVIQFTHAMIAADGGPAAQAALDEWDARIRSARKV